MHNGRVLRNDVLSALTGTELYAESWDSIDPYTLRVSFWVIVSNKTYVYYISVGLKHEIMRLLQLSFVDVR